MKNLYEILEVSEKASEEIIEKAYKTLAKRYHPDLQGSSEQKEKASKKMVELNTAYETLRNEETRKEYDLKLQEERERKKQEEYNKEMTKIKNSVTNNSASKSYSVQSSTSTSQNNYKKDEINNMGELLNHIVGLNRKSTKVKYTNRKGGFKRFLKLLVILFILYIFFKIIWHISFTHNFLLKLENSHYVFKFVINAVKIIIESIEAAVKNAWDFGRIK